MRITGLATGLDMDEIIKNSMKPYRMKVDQMTQKKDVVEIRQKLYRDIIKDGKEFFGKYLDMGKSDTLLLQKNWSSVKFSSNNSSVQVTAGSEAKAGDYTVTGTTAKPAQITITEGIENGKKINIDGKEYTLAGKDGKEIAEKLNEELAKDKKKINVKYTDFAGTGTNKTGLVLEAVSADGKTQPSFTIGGTGVVGSLNKGQEAKAATITGFTIDDLKNGEFLIGGQKKDLNIQAGASNDDVVQALNTALTVNGIKSTATVDDKGNITITNKDKGSIVNPNIEVNVNGTNKAQFTNATDERDTTLVISKSQLGTGEQKIKINGKEITIDLSKAEAGKESEYLKEVLNVAGITDVDAKFENNQIIFSTQSDKELKVERDAGKEQTITGQPAKITIKDNSTGGVYTHEGYGNTVTLDGVTFKVTGEIPAEGVKITGKTDVKELKDKIVGFINDYNKLIEKLNKTTGTRHERGYDPLTAEQKKDMSESEIKLWNERVEKGQLYRDSDINRIASSMKETMRSMLGGTKLESIGIKPVKDYSGSLNGTFTIDENKFTKALEENTEGVMNLFVGKPAPTKEELAKLTPEQQVQRKKETGILNQLHDTFDREFGKSDSLLLRKAGYEGTTSFANNTLTKNISVYEKKIKDMEKDFARREQQLYSKYATLETMMNKLNSQQSNLMSQLGMG